MSAVIIKLAAVKRQKKRARRRPPAGPGEPPATTLFWQAQQVHRILVSAKEAMAEGDHKRVAFLLDFAKRDIERGMEAHVEHARHDFRSTVQDAFGLDATHAEFIGVRKALALLLKSLPPVC